jgi:hypothetical protein
MARWSVSQPCGIGARGHYAPPPAASPASPSSWSPPTLRARSPILDLALIWPRCLNIIVLVKPATVVQWHRQGFRLYWRWRSRSGRPSLDREVRDLIRQVNSLNPLWGAPRIHGEFLKLGMDLSQATVAKYMVRWVGRPSLTGAAFFATKQFENGVIEEERCPYQKFHRSRNFSSCENDYRLGALK